MVHWLDKVLILLQARTSNLRALAELAGEDPQTFYRGVKLSDLDTEGQDLTGMEFDGFEKFSVANDNNKVEAHKLVATIAKTSRQEERIALILQLILHDRARGMSVLAEYQGDKAKFASHALREIRSSLPDSSENTDQLIVASLVAKFFSYTYPMNRGRLLYFLAKHLAKYPIVNQAIRTSLKKTASMFVEEHRLQINQLLDEAD
jgi:hypothetical protein